METTDQNVTLSDNNLKLIGRVKWFNNKAGYGFLTITDGEKTGTDVFVHHTSIIVSENQYRYLVQGEYVQFNLIPITDGKHEVQAFNVTGINSGKLMCETKLDNRSTRETYKQNLSENKAKDSNEIKLPVQKKNFKSNKLRVKAASSNKDDNNEFTLVKNKHVKNTNK